MKVRGHRTVPHGNVLHCTVLKCKALQWNVLPRTVPHSALVKCIAIYSTTLRTLQYALHIYFSALNYTMLHCISPLSIALHCTVLQYTALLYCTSLPHYCTTLHTLHPSSPLLFLPQSSQWVLKRLTMTRKHHQPRSTLFPIFLSAQLENTASYAGQLLTPEEGSFVVSFTPKCIFFFTFLPLSGDFFCILCHFVCAHFFNTYLGFTKDKSLFKSLFEAASYTLHLTSFNNILAKESVPFNNWTTKFAKHHRL